MALETLSVPAMQGPMLPDGWLKPKGARVLRCTAENRNPAPAARISRERARLGDIMTVAVNICMSVHNTRDDMIWALAWAARIHGPKLGALPVWQANTGRWCVGY